MSGVLVKTKKVMEKEEIEKTNLLLGNFLSINSHLISQGKKVIISHELY